MFTSSSGEADVGTSIRTTSRRRRAKPTLICVLAAMLATLALGVVPASASSHTVELAITGFGDQDCSTGSDRLISPVADDFRVEVCVTQGGAPVSGHTLLLHVTHGDGTTETLDKVTDSDGKASFTVEPTSAGTTTAVVCDAEGCYGEVSLEADEPPRPDPVASYSPTGNDIGNTEPIVDVQLDMTDAYTGDTAAPEESSRHDGADIASVSYAGNADGKATFKIVTVGNGRAMFEEGLPRWEMSASVVTPDGGEFTIAVRNNDGQFQTRATSSGAVLEDVEVTLEWADDNTACLGASGLDVPEGSTVTVFTAAARDPEGSGVWDEAGGPVIAASDDPAVASDDADDTGTATTDDSDDTGTATTDDGDDTTVGTADDDGTTTSGTDDGGGLGPFGYGLITVGILLFLSILYWWFVIRRRQPAYRADRWGDLEIVQQETEQPPSEPAVVHLPASSIVIDDPPPQGPCTRAYETWKDSVERLRELEAESEARDPATDPIADLRQDNLNDAREAMNAYRRIYDECLADQTVAEADSATDELGTVTVPPVSTEPAEMEAGTPRPVESHAVVVDKTGLTGKELERAERLEALYNDHMGTGDLADTAIDFWYFNDWHQRTFGEPWFRWTTKENLPGGINNRGLSDLAEVRDLACYEFVHLVAWAAGDHAVRARMEGPEGAERPSGDYSLHWYFADRVVAENIPLDGDPPAGEVVTGVARLGNNNDSGYYHTAISIGDGRVIGLGGDGLVNESATGLIDATFNRAFYSDVHSGPYNYNYWNPEPGSIGN